ncbi:MAG TPA: TusE/DsrC/DsvC family sulfur relay protein [Acidimicrobiia bacterium]|jgi:tRNA 2-thiouridine synthesizing protein E
MPAATIAGKDVHVDSEGFLTDFEEWNEDVARQFAANIGIDLTDAHWKAIHFMRDDFQAQGESPTLRRITQQAGIPTKELFTLFPKKPAKKLAYVAGVPKPVGCV